MNRSTIKKIISIIACVSMLIGYASICSAASINSGSSDYIKSPSCSVGNHNYSYSVSYVHFDGLAVGAFISGLKVKAKKTPSTVINICNVNKSSGSGLYYIPYSGTYEYRLYNNSSKHVTITYSFS